MLNFCMKMRNIGASTVIYQVKPPLTTLIRWWVPGAALAAPLVIQFLATVPGKAAEDDQGA